MNHKLSSILGIFVFSLILFGIAGYLFTSSKINTSGSGAVSSSTPLVATTSTPASPSTKSTSGLQKNVTSQTSTSRISVIKASVQNGTVPLTVSFTLQLNPGSSCSQRAYLLSFGDNTQQDIQIPQNACSNPYEILVSHQYQRVGTFDAVLYNRVLAGEMGTVLGKVSITIQNPVVTTGKTQWGTFTSSPVSGAGPLTTEFTLQAADGNQSASVDYVISFGNGETAVFPHAPSPQKISHVFSSAGSYLVTVSRETQCSGGMCSGGSSPLGNVSISVY